MTWLPDDEHTALVFDAIARARVSMPSLRWFLFGSILTTKRPIGDIDLLVIYFTDNEPTRVRTHFVSIAARIPLHMLFMTAEEAAESNFIHVTGAFELLLAPVGDG